MLNHSQLMPVVSQSQQVMNNMNNNINNQYSQMMMHQLNNNHSHMITNQLQSQQAYWMLPPPRVFESNSRNNNNNNNRKAASRGIRGIDIRNNNNWKDVAALKDLQQQNTVKPKRYISKKRFNNGGKFAPRNTTSFLIRAKKAGGMGVDGYGSMNGLIRVRSPDNDEKSDVEDCSEVERRLDHDLSRFEMISISSNYGGSDNTNNNNNSNGCLLENRVDDQDTHIAQLEEKNLMLKNQLLSMEKEFGKLRTRLQCLEMRNLGSKAAKNDSENEESSELLEENKSSVDNKDCDNGEIGFQGRVNVHMEDGMRKIEANKNEDDDYVNGMAANVDSCESVSNVDSGKEKE
ncbi:uncharacterized protein LOC143585376 [Bidens hawaiensis]|uniref:uncharacterized protein LOC143585376 n=1 Tax=Bidens hawaiensis TaxID=980011 RepID=UPI0040496DEA